MSSFVLLISLILAVFFPPKKPADLHPTLDPVRDKSHAPAIAGAIIRDGTILASGVCGVRALDGAGQQPATLEDRWPVGSCTKPMTRFMLGRLMERGDLTPQATLSALLPAIQMREEYRDVPLSDVLSHRAGIHAYTQIGPRITPFIFKLKGTPIEQRAAFAAHVLAEEPEAKPGTKFVYSNAGYCIAAVIAEVKTAKPWETLMREEVLTPLAMASSIAGPDPSAEDQPKGHMHEGDEYRLPPGQMPGLPVMFPAGGIKATPEDFARFAGAYADIAAGRAVGGLSAATAAKIAELRPGDAAPSARPETFYGGDGLFTAAFAIWPELHLAIAVTTNAGESDEVCAAAIEAIRAAQAPDAPPQAAGGPKNGGPRYGFSMKSEGEDFTIASVEPGSIADKAGLKEGDTIVTINGTDPKTLSHEDLQTITKPRKLSIVVDRDGKQITIELAK